MGGCLQQDTESIKKYKLLVLILSILVIICGIIMIILSIVFGAGEDSILDADFGDMTKDLQKFKNGAFYALIIFSCIAILTGILGTFCNCNCLEKKCAQYFWGFLFGTPLFITWIVFLIVGIVITAVSSAGPENLQKFCDQETNNEQLDWLAQGLYDVDNKINRYASELMCSYECPCLDSKVTDWKKLSHDFLSNYTRTKEVWNPLYDSEGQFMLQNAEGLYRLWTQEEATELLPVYDNFADCNTYLQEQKKEAESREEQGIEHSEVRQEKSSEYYSFVPDPILMDGSIKALTWFEGAYKCSGFCNAGLFYYSLDLSENIPTKPCLQYLKNEIGDSLTYLGVTSIVCGVLMCLVFVFQYILWCPVEDDTANIGTNSRNKYNHN